MEEHHTRAALPQALLALPGGRSSPSLPVQGRVCPSVCVGSDRWDGCPQQLATGSGCCLGFPSAFFGVESSSCDPPGAWRSLGLAMSHCFHHDVPSQLIPLVLGGPASPGAIYPFPGQYVLVPTLCQGWSPTPPAPACSGAVPGPGCPRRPAGLQSPQVPFPGFLQPRLSRRLCPPPAPSPVPTDSPSK